MHQDAWGKYIASPKSEMCAPGAEHQHGWDGAPNICNGINESAPPGATNGTIWGHFIKYIGDLGTSTGTVGCNFSALAPCITVLTE